MLTTDRENPELNTPKENGQDKVYLILSEQERAKGFIRPVRDSYIHVGASLKGLLKETAKILTPEEAKRYGSNIYGYADYDESYKPLVGRGLTKQAYYDLLDGKTHSGGCKSLTKMDINIAETYARNPKFYGKTFCCSCLFHLPVSEFVWDGTNEEVGS